MSQQSVPSVSSVLAVRDAATMRSISPFRSSASDFSFDSLDLSLEELLLCSGSSRSHQAERGRVLPGGQDPFRAGKARRELCRHAGHESSALLPDRGGGDRALRRQAGFLAGRGRARAGTRPRRPRATPSHVPVRRSEAARRHRLRARQRQEDACLRRADERFGLFPYGGGRAAARKTHRRRRRLLVVTHDMDLVAECCDAAVLLERGSVLRESEIDAAFLAETSAYLRRGSLPR